jgi:hypothetical protein
MLVGVTPWSATACVLTLLPSAAKTAMAISGCGNARAQVTHLAVLGLSFVPSCSATIRTRLLTATPSS